MLKMYWNLLIIIKMLVDWRISQVQEKHSKTLDHAIPGGSGIQNLMDIYRGHLAHSAWQPTLNKKITLIVAWLSTR